MKSENSQKSTKVGLTYFYIILAAVCLAFYTASSVRYLSNKKRAETLEEGSNTDPSVIWSCVLYNMGGRVLPPIRYKMEVSRFVLSQLLHKHFFHLASNLVLLFYLLKTSAQIYSILNLLACFIFGGISSNLLSSIMSPHKITVGLSPSIFCLLGLIFAKIIDQKNKNHSKVIRILKDPVTPIGLCILILGFLGDSDIPCHLLGVVFGILHGFCGLS